MPPPVPAELIQRTKDAVRHTDMATRYRDGLLSGIDPGFLGSIPVGRLPAIQIESDIDACNTELADGSVPLERWLENAARLRSPLADGVVFQGLLAEVRALVGSGPVERWQIPLPTQNFRERPDIVAKIDQALKAGRATALVALRGLGGIGKTQLARRYADLRRTKYHAGVWIAAQSPADIVASLAGMAGAFGVAPDKDQEETARRVVAQVCASPRWLAVFDNAESAADLRPWIDRFNTPGDVLITSRSDAWESVAKPVSVTTWSVDESVDYLLERTGQADRESAEELAKELGGLVLALEHAAAFMLAGDRPSLADYLERWRARLDRCPSDHDHGVSVAKTLGLSIDALREKSAVAHDVLCLFSFLAPDLIPRKHLLEAGSSGLPDSIANAFADPDEWNDVVDELRRYSLVAREPEVGPVVGYRVHRVVQQVMRDRTDAEGRELWITSAGDVVNKAYSFDPEQPEHWPACDALAPHARALRLEIGSGTASASYGRMLNQASLYLQARGSYHDARDFRELALESALRQFGPDHPNVATYRSNLATILRALGEHGEARRQIEKALESDLRQFGPDHPNVALRRSNLAIILRDWGEHGEARRQIEMALEADLRQFGPDHPNVAVSRSNLANILGALGEHGEARRQIEMALESDLRQLGPDHPTVALRRGVFAQALYQLGEYRAALEQIDLALDVFTKKLPPGHPHIGTATRDRAVILAALGDTASAATTTA
jgi:tetratricopeptide (TPR) repeat protein